MYLVGKAPGIPSTYKLVFIIVVILQSEIVQVVNLVQVDPNKMAAARVAMVIVVDDVLLENPYCFNSKPIMLSLIFPPFPYSTHQTFLCGALSHNEVTKISS